MAKTIKEIADKLGVSKQSVFYKIKNPPLSNDLEPFMSKVGGVLTVSSEGEKLIEKAFTDVKQDNKEPLIIHTLADDNRNQFFDILKAEIEAKNNLIIRQQETIDNLTAAIKEQMQKEPKIVENKRKLRVKTI